MIYKLILRCNSKMSNITLECRECKRVLLEKDFTNGSETEFRVCISCSEKEIILERCIVCAWTSCNIDHKKDQKTMEFIEHLRSKSVNINNLQNGSLGLNRN